MTARQLELFDIGETLTELSVEALQGDRESIRVAANSLLTLVKYHEALERKPTGANSRAIATRMLGETARLRQILGAADVLAVAARAVLDGAPGAFTDLCDALHDFNRMRR